MFSDLFLRIEKPPIHQDSNVLVTSISICPYFAQATVPAFCAVFARSSKGPSELFVTRGTVIFLAEPFLSRVRARHVSKFCDFVLWMRALSPVRLHLSMTCNAGHFECPVRKLVALSTDTSKFRPITTKETY